ncbi:hypothetical protein [Protaetiibacter intestinalis]|uniref:FHA domain-containing protein n=1 Tax=Protaetiibacter intestinalis TaxID=2419774 RepID=A0A387BD72_9MICO|nr:hypothetical protein [Protaetiibacter intestinalis]AYF98829.1 hypothetical protein D7I47_11575 [Protaetiibacter intestinalis]
MHEDDDDTVPQAVVAGLARARDAVDEVDNALGDTVVRGRGSRKRRPAAPVVVDLPPVPQALRPHYRFRVGSGETWELDRPARIGRRPSAPRVPSELEPRLVAVESPNGGISSTHLELREQGSAVVATDLRTLNGSEIRVPGSPVQVLQRGASIVVTPGSSIDLGEGVIIEILTPGRPGVAR